MDSEDTNKLELTDKINVESVLPEGFDPNLDISSDLAESIEKSSLDINSSQFDIQRAEDTLSQFQKLETEYSRELVDKVGDALFPSIEHREEYYKDVAGHLYNEIYKQSRIFLKTWCKVNGFEQKWGNPYLKYFSTKNLTQLSEFVPQVYSLRVVNKETKDETVLADLMPTSREATIAGAKKLGFDNSTERKLAFAKFSKTAIDVIINDERYLKEKRSLAIFNEHLKQMETRRYIPSSLRDRWIKILEAANNMKSDLI